MITLTNKVSEKVHYSIIQPGEFFGMDNGKNLYYKMEDGYIHIAQAGNPRSRGNGYVVRSVPVRKSFLVSRVDVAITIS